MADKQPRRRSDHVMVRIDTVFADSMRLLAEHNRTNLTIEVNAAVREKLERLVNRVGRLRTDLNYALRRAVSAHVLVAIAAR